MGGPASGHRVIAALQGGFFLNLRQALLTLARAPAALRSGCPQSGEETA